MEELFNRKPAAPAPAEAARHEQEMEARAAERRAIEARQLKFARRPNWTARDQTGRTVL